MKHKGKKVLILNPTIKQIQPMAKLLNCLEYKVYWKPCVNKAFLSLGLFPFDLIIFVHELANISGLEFISRIRCPKFCKKVIFLTKNYKRGERNRTLQLGIGACIPSSVGLVDLVIIIDQALGGKNTLCMN